MKRFLSVIICIVMMLTSLSGFCFAVKSDSSQIALDYDALFDKAYVINGSWQKTDLKNNNSLSFYFRGRKITESYNSARHFTNFDSAYNYYLSQSPDILEDLPVFIFAPGTYDYIITVHYSAIILGANAGINPNASAEWTLEGMENGVALNQSRTQETVFTKGLTRTTRASGDDAKWVYPLEQKESEAGKKADIKFIIDGVKITGSVGISQYDYSNHSYDMTLNGQAIKYTPKGKRTTLTALLNSVVDNFSGSGANALFSARCNSYNKNDAVLNNVRLTNIKNSAKFLFNKFFRNLTIDGMYFANSDSTLFGSTKTTYTFEDGSSFCGSENGKTAEYDQNIEIKNSIFYKNRVVHPICLGNCNAGDGYTKMTANIHNNFFYDAVYFEEEKDYWGIFLVNSAKTGVDYTVNITDNVFHQQTTALRTLFNGNTNYQKSKTTVNFNRNKVTGKIECIYPNTNWNSNSYNYLNTLVFYDFSDNFHAASKDDIASRPIWIYPPKTHLANKYDHTTAPYYLDYNLTIHSSDFEILKTYWLGNDVKIEGCNVIANCSNMGGEITPEIVVSGNADVQIYKDIYCTKPVSSIDLSLIEKGECYFIKITKKDVSVIGTLYIHTGTYSDINSVDEIEDSSFNLPIVSIYTEKGAPVVDKENYVNCSVNIDNTDSEFCLSHTAAGIRYRGNSTLVRADKKPYRIKFEKKQNLFGMGKAKSWVLLANALDKTMVRNAIAFEIGSQLGLEYTSQFRYVNLYLNGEFQGLYLLCEQTQTGKTRVNVEEDETGKVDTGYLIEFAGNGDPEEDRSFVINEVPKDQLADGVKNNWRTDTIKAYLKTPELEFCTDAQVEFISDYVNKVNHAILTQDMQSFDKLCDIESFAKYFVTSTILNNGDGGYQIYMYKKENGGKLYAGPLWDFDQSSGATTQCGDTYDKWYTGSSYPWFDSFSNWPEFLTYAKSFYVENYDEIQDIIKYYTEQFYPDNAYDFHANDLLWNSVESDYWRITETIKTLKSYSANFAHLSTWFKNRLSWLDNAYKDVTILPSSITLDKTKLLFTKKDSYTFTVNTRPSYTDPYQINWSSSNSNVASVNNGVVTANKDGKCVITATVVGTQITANCSVTVCINHKYDNDCDTTCNVCQSTRKITHSFSEYTYNYDATSDKDGTKTRICSVCKKEETVTAKGTKLINSSKTFKDVPKDKWFKTFVDYAVTHGIFSGTSKTTFSPNTNITRAQFVQVLANLEGIDTSNNKVKSGFSDVPSGKWFTAAIKWASEKKIVSGMGDGKFEPNANVTREQMCVMLVNYAKYKGITLKKVEAKASFADDNKISKWAKDAVYACQMADIVNGKGDNKFDPKGTGTRAEASVIFTKFHQSYMK